MIYNEIATGYFSQLEKEYNLEYLGKSKGSLGWEGVYRDKNGQLYIINYADYMGGGLDILYMIDIMPELEVKKL
jgi:hypothetical protein